MVKAIVGANWGDEGKGKITDMLAQKSEMCIRDRLYRKKGKEAFHHDNSGGMALFCAFFAVPDCLKRSPHKGKCPSQI